MALAKYAVVYTRSWAANSTNQRVRLAAKAEQLEQEIALLREEIRIKDARMARIAPNGLPAIRSGVLGCRQLVLASLCCP
jgi:hypothetical protein